MTNPKRGGRGVMTSRRDDDALLRDLVRRAHDTDPDRLEPEVASGLADVQRRAALLPANDPDNLLDAASDPTPARPMHRPAHRTASRPGPPEGRGLAVRGDSPRPGVRQSLRNAGPPPRIPRHPAAKLRHRGSVPLLVVLVFALLT